MTAPELERALRETEVPDARRAEERAWEGVAAAFAARERRRRPRWLRPAVAVAVASAAAVALTVTPPGEAVADWVARVVRAPAPAPPPLLPAAGRILVETEQGSAIAGRRGDPVALPGWRDAAWSPFGRFVAATRGGTVAALDPRGRVRWRVTRPYPVAQPAWSADGFRVAYRSGDGLRVVAGDGTGDRLLAGPIGPARALWQPGRGYALAWADRSGRVVVHDVFAGRRLWRSPAGPQVERLLWSRDGATIVAVGTRSARAYAFRGGRALGRFESASPVLAAALDAEGRLLVARARGSRDSELVAVPARRPAARSRLLHAGAGRLSDVALSPDGRWLLLARRDADRWIFLRTGRGAGVAAASEGVSRRLGSRAVSVRGWAIDP